MEKNFMNEALNEAKTALKKGEVPIGCILIKQNKIIAKAHNTTNIENNPLAHAEIVALRNIKDYDGIECYVTCEPCGMCMGILQRCGIRTYYGCSNYVFGGITVLNMESDNFVKIECDESLRLLKLFYKNENYNAPEDKRKKKSGIAIDT